MEATSIQLEASWKEKLLTEFEKPYMKQLKEFLSQQYKNKRVIYPKSNEYFLAMNLTPFEQVKVVILGQDPYHGPNQAHGLSFSVRPGVGLPPSLVNIYKELNSDLGIPPAKHGFLKYWSQQGVLLLNSVLTVEQGAAASHRGKGWETFTDSVIHQLNARSKPVVFLLWGSYAQKKGQFIDRQRHKVLEAPHPSPLSAHRGFLGCRHFSQANEALLAWGQAPIDWELPGLSDA